MIIELLAMWQEIHFSLRILFALLLLWIAIFLVAHGGRYVLLRTRFKSILYHKRVNRAFMRVLVAALAVAAVFTVSFGLYREMFSVETVYAPADEHLIDEPYLEIVTPPTEAWNPEGLTNPEGLPIPEGPANPEDFWLPVEAVYLFLNDAGMEGAFLRDKPGGPDSTIIGVVWGDMALVYLHAYKQDEEDAAVRWLRVRDQHGTEGYIKQSMVQ
jgi:hypothetical protein